MSLDLLPHFFFQLGDGGRLRYAQFAPSTALRGTVLIVPGAREFIEKKHYECAPRLLEAGLRVIIVEPRGQGLSSRFLSGDTYQRNHIDDFKSHLNDLRLFYSQVVQPGLTAPLIVHGHSLGGHVVLRWLAEDHPDVAGAFVTSPMVALSGMHSQMAAYGVTWLGASLFDQATSYLPSHHDYNDEDKVFPANPLTQDELRFRMIENYFAAHPDLKVGGFTWGWMLAALKSMHRMHERHYLASITVPVLALTAELDRITPVKESVGHLNMIPHVRTHVIKGARHDVLNELDPLRQEAWHHIDDFLKMLMAV